MYIKFGSINFEGIRIFRKKEKIISPHLSGIRSDTSKAKYSLKCNPRLLVKLLKDPFKNKSL